GRLQRGRDPVAALPAAAEAGRCRDLRGGDPCRLRRPGRGDARALPGNQPRRGDAGHHPRRAVRLDRRAAGTQAGQTGPAVVPVLLQPRLPGRQRRRPARIPRRRAAVRVRQPRPHPAAVAEGTGLRRRAGADRGDVGLLGLVRAQRPASRRRPAGVAALWPGARLYGLRRRAGARRKADAGHVRTRGAGGVPPPRAGRPALALERRHRRAAAARRSAWMSVIHGQMQDWPLTIDRFLEHGAKWHAGVEVVTAGEDGSTARVGYAGLQRRSREVSELLAGMGVGRGDVVATLAWNTQSHMETWYAVMGMGAVCQTLNPRVSEAHLAAMLEQSGARVLVAAADLAPLARGIATRAGTVERILSIDGTAVAEDGAPGIEPLERLLDAGSGAPRKPAGWGGFDERMPCGLCFTSGTTGAPKGVTYTHRGVFLHTLRALQADTMALSQ